MDLLMQYFDKIVDIAIVFTLLFTALQTLNSKKAIYLSSTQKIYEEDKLIRTYFIKSFPQIDNLVKELNTKDIDPFLIYMKDDYKELREIGTHYEFLGTLLATKMVPKKSIFRFISAPDNFWHKTQELREIMRTKYRKDFWENFEKLYQTQVSARTKDQLDIAMKYIKNQSGQKKKKPLLEET
jgi:hypothetical protein